MPIGVIVNVSMVMPVSYLWSTYSEVMEWQRLQCGQSSMKMSGKFFRRPDDIR